MSLSTLTAVRLNRPLIPPTQAELIRLDREKRRALVTRFERLYVRLRLAKKKRWRGAVPESLVRVIAQHEATKAGVDIEQMFTRDKIRKSSRVLSRARWRVMRRLHRYGYSTTAIGHSLGLDHTTIIYGLRRLAAIEAQK